PPYIPAEFPMGVGPEAPPPAPAPPPEAPGFFGNVGIGARRAVLSAADAGRVFEDAVGAASRGDFGPLQQAVELIGRGAAPYVAAAAGNPAMAGQNFAQEQVAQAAPIAQLTREREARMAQQPELYSQEAVAERQRLNAQAALDPSLAGKIMRGG